MGPEALAQVLRPLALQSAPPSLLVGLHTADDAAVYQVNEEQAIISTADFFPPVVDDPYAFGAIAAANALSDIYAMGGQPLMAINLVAWPADLDPTLLSEILRGGTEIVAHADAVIAGGHTVTDAEPKYGLAVTGMVHPRHILTKGGAKPGDYLVLSKPLGTGIITTAHKQDMVVGDDLDAEGGQDVQPSQQHEPVRAFGGFRADEEERDDQKDAEGFIPLQALRLRLAAQRDGRAPCPP